MQKVSIWQRFKAKTPPFFKRVQALGVTIAAVGEGILKLSYLPPNVQIIVQNAVCAAGAMVLIAQFAVHPPETETLHDA